MAGGLGAGPVLERWVPACHDGSLKGQGSAGSDAT
jgi:hypothetical protein